MENSTDAMKKHYRVVLRFDPDGYWVAEHPELPGCVADGETAAEALASLDTSRDLWIESRRATGLPVPEPGEEPQYSGRLLLRIAKSLHRELAQEAEAEGVSLNSWIARILAGRHARKDPASSAEDSLRVA
jgi:predicted RNase H-like HicB family nuclease